MHQDSLINIMDPLLRNLNLTHPDCGMYCKDLTAYIRQRNLLMIYQSQTAHAASCKRIDCAGTSSAKAEYCNLRHAEFFYTCISNEQFHS